LLDYARSRNDKRLTDFAEREVREHFLHYEKACHVDKEKTDRYEFMGLCSNWGWLVGKVLAHDEFVPWLKGFIPVEETLAPMTEPITDPRRAHQNGLNFSRAWGFWGIYDKTGDPRFVRAYVDNFEATYRQPEAWRGQYETVGHWVAQFGMFALMPMFALRPQASTSFSDQAPPTGN